MTRRVTAGGVAFGGGAPVTVQSMTNTPTADYEATSAQLRALKRCGCDIVRVAVSSAAEARLCRRYIDESRALVVADIQYDYRLAVACSDSGFKKIRFNPGNIGSEDNVRSLVSACKSNGTVIRVGVNTGSLERDILEKFGRTAEALKESALRHVRLLEDCGFYDIVVSVKSSDVRVMNEAYRLLADACDYPLHLGVTESGDAEDGTVKSAIGIGSLLLSGIGDTIRVSLTADPIQEVLVAKRILTALGLKKEGLEVVSCPTCSRCHYDLFGTLKKVKAAAADVAVPLKIAVMGCAVNGPGEAADADLGIAGGGDGRVVLFEKGVVTDICGEAEGIILLMKKIEDFKNA